jgi:hypothetical protein
MSAKFWPEPIFTQLILPKSILVTAESNIYNFRRIFFHFVLNFVSYVLLSNRSVVSHVLIRKIGFMFFFYFIFLGKMLILMEQWKNETHDIFQLLIFIHTRTWFLSK